MKEKILSRLYWFIFAGSKFIFNNVLFRGNINSELKISKGVKLKNVSITLNKDSCIHIEENVDLHNLDINVSGELRIGAGTKIYSSSSRRNNILINGSCICGTNNRLEADIRVRFGGKLTIGSFNNINYGSEVRCDEFISIGDFNQISYNVMIWDTNTHTIYTAEERRVLTLTKGLGNEIEKPKTKLITIGNDCWIGRDVAILKGVSISNKCIVGFRTLLSNMVINENSTIVSENRYKCFNNDL